jgi:hypothetical protein
MAAAIDQAVRKLMSIEHIRRRITLRIHAGNSVEKVGEARPVNQLRRLPSKAQFNGVGRLRTYIQLHAFGVRVKAPLRIVTTPSSTVLCSACIIDLNVYGAKRPHIGNLPSGRTILS